MNAEPQPAVPDEAVTGVHADVTRLLFSNIVPFWLLLVDRVSGGYRMNHDVQGNWRGPGPKFLVTQARTVWFWSRLARAGYDRDTALDIAAHGYEFLRNSMWDRRAGGFFWSVTFDGAAPVRDEKHMYGQAAGLWALSEYARASGDAEARALAQGLFELVEERAHDDAHGGYREGFASDWGHMPAAVGSLGFPNGLKLRNTHLHLLEAVIALSDLGHDARIQKRLLELLVINTVAVRRSGIAAGRDPHLADWSPTSGGADEPVSYGHDLESIWLVREACRALELPDGPLVLQHRSVFDVALEYGLDAEDGGFYEEGLEGLAADRPAKVWWVQAEGLLAALTLFQLTGEAPYLDVFRRSLRWITEHQADWQHGDWHHTVGPDGGVSGDKAGEWKDPCHQGRAMIETLGLLTSGGS